MRGVLVVYRPLLVQKYFKRRAVCVFFVFVIVRTSHSHDICLNAELQIAE